MSPTWWWKRKDYCISASNTPCNTVSIPQDNQINYAFFECDPSRFLLEETTYKREERTDKAYQELINQITE